MEHAQHLFEVIGKHNGIQFSAVHCIFIVYFSDGAAERQNYTSLFAKEVDRVAWERNTFVKDATNIVKRLSGVAPGYRIFDSYIVQTNKDLTPWVLLEGDLVLILVPCTKIPCCQDVKGAVRH